MTKDIEDKSSSCMFDSPDRFLNSGNQATNTIGTVNKFEDILPDLFTVYRHTNQEVVTSESLPVGFVEENPLKIVESLQSHQVGKVTSLEQKFRDNQYTRPYELYHDIKAVSSILLNRHENGSAEYKEYDFFYKFATELLLREVHNSLVFNNQFLEIKTELESQIEDDFNKIFHSYNLSNGEVITYVSTIEEQELINGGYYQQQYVNQPKVKRVQPLFSSVISRSELDNRQSIVKGPYGIAKVIPSMKDSVSDNVLDNLSPITNKVPSPLDQPTNILHDFFHPTWYTVSMPQWLTYKSQSIKPATLSANKELEQGTGAESSQKLSILRNRDNDFSSNATNIWGPGNYYRSFVPSRDLTRSIVSHRLRANTWLQHIGLAEIAKIKKGFMGVKEEEAVPKEDVSEKKEEESEKKEPEEDAKPNEEGAVSSKDRPVADEINVANLVNWNPTKLEDLKYLKDHKEDLIDPKRLQKMISISLLKLNKARQDRFARSDVRNPLAPEHEEFVLYNRLVKLISIAIKLFKLNPGSFSYDFSKKIPVLVSEFSGTLPGVTPNKILGGSTTIATGKLNRLPTLKGPTPYRKRPARY
ncbi:Chromatin structure-remodeling complex protein RSC58 [Candida viswanathii]|uniref:Chromatin structure-remodeling complex protein RSC58 n=1 Tax=Candida viswanathii TaxID=5486 RepID=A0A367XLB5_9ASCO|nr:Chromatin structure-remodeling complex protein RSC58 [Candida viswanathii]